MSQREHSAATHPAGIRWIPTLLCLWLVLGYVATSAAQSADALPARPGSHASAEARPRLRFLAHGTTLEVVDAATSAMMSAIAIPEGLKFCQVVANVLLVALQRRGTAVIDLQDQRRPVRLADIATDTAVAWIESTENGVILHSRDRRQTLEYRQQGAKGLRLLQTLTVSAPSKATARAAANACERRSATEQTADETTADASLRTITKRDGTELTGQVRRRRPAVSLRTPFLGDVSIPWDDIALIVPLLETPADGVGSPTAQPSSSPALAGSTPRTTAAAAPDRKKTLAATARQASDAEVPEVPPQPEPSPSDASGRHAMIAGGILLGGGYFLSAVLAGLFKKPLLALPAVGAVWVGGEMLVIAGNECSRFSDWRDVCTFDYVLGGSSLALVGVAQAIGIVTLVSGVILHSTGRTSAQASLQPYWTRSGGGLALSGTF